MQSAELFSPHVELASSLLKACSEEGDGAHDVSHLLRVWKNVRVLQRAEGGDLEVLTAAVLLHDCVAVEKNSPQRSEGARLAARKAEGLLLDLGWTKERVAQVTHAIETHSFSGCLAPVSLEAKVLQDADRLDALGTVGIARCFYTAGRMNSRLYEPMDPRGERRELDDRVFALDHFSTKLLHLRGRFQTAKGACLAEERHERLERFRRELLEEVEWTDG